MLLQKINTSIHNSAAEDNINTIILLQKINSSIDNIAAEDQY